mgnify:CR=1 FL=1
MLFKKVRYDEKDIPEFDYEEVPAEELYEDGELTALQVNNKVLDKVFYTGEWKLVRRVDWNDNRTIWFNIYNRTYSIVCSICVFNNMLS